MKGGCPCTCSVADGQSHHSPSSGLAQARVLLERSGLELQVFGVTNSQWMLLSADPISLSTWETALQQQETEASLDSFTYHFATSHVPYRVIIDCTASSEVPCHYKKCGPPCRSAGGRSLRPPA